MKSIQEYTTTVNRSVYNKVHKERHARCSYCKWHGPHSENDSWKCYYKSDYNGKAKEKYPNWKLVSKNKKQWMKKTLIFENVTNSHGRWTYWINIKWHNKIRPK
jgi:hypothetical protein